MFRKLAALALTVLAACAPPATLSAVGATSPKAAHSVATDVYASQMTLIESMAKDFPTVEADVRWLPCGEENSAYSPAERTIYLCTDMDIHPGPALMFAAHEMGHAIATQLAGTADESAADQIGALEMIRHGLTGELLEGALYFKAQDQQGHWDGDPHPSNGFRAWHMACLADGSGPDGSPICQALYQSTKAYWDLRLHDVQVGGDD